MNIAVILPINKADYMAHCVIDGMISLYNKKEISFKITKGYPGQYNLNNFELEHKEFIEYAKDCDLVVLIDGKLGAKIEIAEEINCFHKTIFIDGSEVGKNNRYDFTIQNALIDGTYTKGGRIKKEILNRCALYFRREKPYINKIIPFPFSIPMEIVEKYDKKQKKDIDFVAIFGQDEYPIMRRYSQNILKKYCTENGFNCVTETTTGYSQKDENRTSGREEFYKILARSKVGISIGGGGFDTMRFWELLGSNCLLLTEKIDIYQPDDTALKYERIREFSNLMDFEYELNKLGKFIKSTYNQETLNDEYKKIISDHSAESRVKYLIKQSLETIQTHPI